MPTGIFNPYVEKKPKEDFRSVTDPDNPYDSEHVDPGPGNIRLDGDSYVMILDKLEDVEGVATRLGNTVADVQEAHKDVLLRHGIELIPSGETRELDEEEAALPTPVGHICVYVGPQEESSEQEVEVKAFRRIARAFLEVDRRILTKHQITVIRRA